MRSLLVGRWDSETCQILQLSLTFFPFFSAHSKTSSISSQSGESPRPLRMRSQAKWTKEGERERERERNLCGFLLSLLHQLFFERGDRRSRRDEGKFRPWAGKSHQLKTFLLTLQSAH